MAKVKTVWVCNECGKEHFKWAGRCSDCGEWNTLEEVVESKGSGTFGFGRQARSGGTLLVGSNPPQKIEEIRADAYQRIPLPLVEFTRVLGGGVVPGALVLVGGDPGIGKCVTGDTRIFDPSTGDYLPITQWAHTPRPVLALDEGALELAPAMATCFHEQGVQPIVEVQTRLGRRLRCTLSHPILTPHGWRAVGDVAIGERLAAPAALPYFGRESLDEAEVKLIAYMLSDGSAQSAICVTNRLPEVEDDLEAVAHTYGMNLIRYDKPNTDAKQYRFTNDLEKRQLARVASALHAAKAEAEISWQAWARKANVTYSQLNMWRRGDSVPSEEALRRLAEAVGVSVQELCPDARYQAEMTTPIARLLEKVGLRFATASNKRIPDRIFRLPKEQLALFLRTLFTCDGSIYVNSRGQPGISYSSISQRLVEDVQHLLLRFGFVATVRRKVSRVNDAPYVAYEAILLGVAEVQEFLREIGIMGREEAQRRIAAMPLPTLPSTQRDTIPTGQPFWQHLQRVMGGLSFAEVSRRAGVRFKNRRHDRPLTRQTVQRLTDGLDDSYLVSLAYGDVYWDEIVSIEPAGEAPVYDLTVPERANFVANDLIIHNSTLLQQVAGMMAAELGPVLYLSGEESVYQIKMRAERLGVADSDLYLLSETNLDIAIEHIRTLRPQAVIIDSIQTVYLSDLSSSAGSVSQVRECAARLMQLAKSENLPIFLVGHVTKEGHIAGPRVLEHIVDTVLYLEGDRFHTYRLLRAQKNRFGSTNEVGVFEMKAEGMVEVLNPSEAFLAEHQAGATGAAVAVTLEGTRPILLEMQALVSQSAFSQPRRTANGIDLNRLHLLLAVLGKRVGLPLHNQDVFVNVVGGMRINEPAADLALAAAIASSFREKPIARGTALIGEIGLGGELRSVSQLDKRLNEAAKLGFTRCILPKHGKPGRRDDIEVLPVGTLVEALHLAQKER